jgi:hypothetical protein
MPPILIIISLLIMGCSNGWVLSSGQVTNIERPPGGGNLCYITIQASPNIFTYESRRFEVQCTELWRTHVGNMWPPNF